MPYGFFASLARARLVLAALVIAVAGSLTVATADARIGGGSSIGSRGSRTFSMPSATPTAPRVSPFQRSDTPSSSFANARSGGLGGGFLGGGFGRGLLGGFLGAGLFGMLFGSGFGGGLGGGMSLIGLLLQIGLLYLGFRLIMGFFRNRQQSFGGNNSAFGGGPSQAPGSGMFDGLFGQGSGFGSGAARGAAPQGAPITIAPDDYQTFERRLVDLQDAYSNGDIGGLRRLATPEMSGNFQQELADNDRQGVVNRISDVRLQQGDLSEAWREGGSEYATVAMRFSLIDVTQEKQSGRVVAGNATMPQNVTEVWTFVRQSGSGPDGWVLSGIQQA